MKSAILVIFKRDEIVRVIYFEDHNQAVDAAMNYRENGFYWHMAVPEIIKAGESVPNLPPLQKKLFD